MQMNTDTMRCSNISVIIKFLPITLRHLAVETPTREQMLQWP